MRVRVPGSTSNIGSGFDVLGLALDLPLVVEVRGEAPTRHALVECRGTAADWPHDDSNLLFRAFDLARSRLGLPRRHVEFRVDSLLPLSRGLGSSAAATVAGLLLGSHDAPTHGGDDAEHARRLDLAQWAVELEGHPDNACPSLFGGLVAALDGPQGTEPAAFPVHPDLRFCVAWSPQELRTSAARKALPETIPHGLAVRQSRRLLALLEGLRTGDPERLAVGAQDELHVPYRLPLIDGGADALDAAREAGALLATISGSGSALFAVAPRESIEEVAGAMRTALERVCGAAVAHVIDVVLEPPRVESA